MHVSSEGMIIYLIESMSRVLQSIKKDPIMMTLSRLVKASSGWISVTILCRRCVDDGYCSLEQADLIQSHVEKKLGKLYKIDDFLGKRLSKSLVNYEDDLDDNEYPNEKSSTGNDDENAPRSKMDSISDDDLSSMDVMSGTKNAPLKHNMDSTMTSSKNINNQRSPSPSKSNLSPGEIKAISPSSLSDASPISS